MKKQFLRRVGIVAIVMLSIDMIHTGTLLFIFVNPQIDQSFWLTFFNPQNVIAVVVKATLVSSLLFFIEDRISRKEGPKKLE